MSWTIQLGDGPPAEPSATTAAYRPAACPSASTHSAGHRGRSRPAGGAAPGGNARRRAPGCPRRARRRATAGPARARSRPRVPAPRAGRPARCAPGRPGRRRPAGGPARPRPPSHGRRAAAAPGRRAASAAATAGSTASAASSRAGWARSSYACRTPLPAELRRRPAAAGVRAARRGPPRCPPYARTVRTSSRFSKSTSGSYPPIARKVLRRTARVPGQSPPNARLSSVRPVSHQACQGSGSKWFCGRTSSTRSSSSVHRAQPGLVVPDVVVGDHHVFVPGQRRRPVSTPSTLPLAPRSAGSGGTCRTRPRQRGGVPGEEVRRGAVDHGHVHPPGAGRAGSRSARPGRCRRTGTAAGRTRRGADRAAGRPARRSPRRRPGPARPPRADRGPGRS